MPPDPARSVWPRPSRRTCDAQVSSPFCAGGREPPGRLRTVPEPAEWAGSEGGVGGPSGPSAQAEPREVSSEVATGRDGGAEASVTCPAEGRPRPAWARGGSVGLCVQPWAARARGPEGATGKAWENEDLRLAGGVARRWEATQEAGDEGVTRAASFGLRPGSLTLWAGQGGLHSLCQVGL